MTRRQVLTPILGGALLVALAAVVILYLRSATPPTEAWEPHVRATGPTTRSITLYFGNADGSGLIAEHREVPAASGDEAAIRSGVDELLRGPAGPGVGLFDPRCRVRATFLDAEGSLVLDFAGDPFPDSASDRTCAMAVSSLMRLLTARHPGIRSVSLLADGVPLTEVERRLALPLSLDPSRWLEEVDRS